MILPLQVLERVESMRHAIRYCTSRGWSLLGLPLLMVGVTVFNLGTVASVEAFQTQTQSQAASRVASESESRNPETGNTDPGQAADDNKTSVDDYLLDIRLAIRAEDLDKALDVVQEAINAYPEHVPFKMNRLLLLVQRDQAALEKAEGKLEPIAASLIETGDLARELWKMKQQFPEQLLGVFPAAFLSQCRACAVRGEDKKALESLQLAADGGFADLEKLVRDEQLARFVATDGFQDLATKLRAQLVEQARQKMASFPSYPFGFELAAVRIDKPVQLSDYEGKVLIVDFWGTWCPPCRDEIPHFVRLAKTYDKSELEIVGLAYEKGEPDAIKPRLAKFLKANQINYRCLIGTEEVQNQVPQFPGFPTTLFIDHNQRVRMQLVGYHSYDQLEAYAKVLLEESASASE